MPSDDHPIIKEARTYAPDIETRTELYERAALHTAMMPPADRAALVKGVEQAIAEDTGSLREKAQLIALHRHISDAHEKITRAGR
jgi:hypothetical protein